MMFSKTRRFIGTLSIALILFFVALPPIGLYSPQLIQPSQGYYGGNYVGGPIRIGLDTTLIAPSLLSDNSPKIQIDQLSYQVVEPVAADNICFDAITVADTYMYSIFGNLKDFFRTENVLNNLGTLCYAIGSSEPGENFHEIDLRNIQSESISTDIFMAGSNSFWYPFDGYKFDFAIQVAFHLEKEAMVISNTVTVPESFFIFPSDEVNWDITISSKRYEGNISDGYQLPLEYPYDQINVIVSRPFYIKLAYPLLISFIILFLSLLSTIDTTDVFIEASVGLLFGIFGIRQLLEPPNTEIRTFLDLVLVMIYSLFALILLQHIILVFIKTRNSEDKHQSGSTFLAFPESKIIHIPSCVYLQKVSIDGLKTISDLSTAKTLGYRVCKICESSMTQKGSTGQHIKKSSARTRLRVPGIL